MTRLVLVGPPGAGKGTQAGTLSEKLGVPHISTGDLFRAHIGNATELGRSVQAYLDEGKLVPDEVTNQMVRERLAEADTRQGFILDGFPRTIAQADGLGSMLERRGQKIDAVVYFDVSEPELVRRLTGRRLCRACQTPYHLVSAPPRREGVCDKCGGELYQRQDDSEDTVRNRLAVYERQTAPLLDYYRQRGLLHTVTGEGPPDKIRQALRDVVGALR